MEHPVGLFVQVSVGLSVQALFSGSRLASVCRVSCLLAQSSHVHGPCACMDSSTNVCYKDACTAGPCGHRGHSGAHNDRLTSTYILWPPASVVQRLSSIIVQSERSPFRCTLYPSATMADLQKKLADTRRAEAEARKAATLSHTTAVQDSISRKEKPKMKLLTQKRKQRSSRRK